MLENKTFQELQNREFLKQNNVIPVLNTHDCHAHIESGRAQVFQEV